MSITKLCLPISRDSDVTSFLTAGPGRTINWLIKIEGHRPPDNNEVTRALPFYTLRSLDKWPWKLTVTLKMLLRYLVKDSIN